MPTPKFTPGARLIPLVLTAPAFQGLNTENEGTILGREWATVLDNAVFDSAGRPAARNGFTSITSTANGDTFKRIFEYYQADGTSELIASADDDIYDSLDSTPVSIDGTLTITDGNIKFANFNDKVIAFGIGTGGIPAVRTSGNFADITVNSGTAPTSGIGTSAFGRIWAVDTDGKTLRYSALLDETRWDVADGGGSIDFSKVWPSGQDDIVAVEEFGGRLVIFGSNNTVIMQDNADTALGIDPTALFVSDTIPHMGAISQFAITRILGDLWVMTTDGIVSLQRELVQKSTPFDNISKNVQSLVKGYIQAESTADDITLMYSPRHALVVAVFPTSSKQVVFDTRGRLPDGSYRATTWGASLQTLAYERDATRMIGALSTGADGEAMNYTGFDDDDSSYSFTYESGWLDLGEEMNVFLKYVKRMASVVFVEQNVSVTHKLKYDFGDSSFDQSCAVGGGGAEWGTAEWGTNGVYNINDPAAVPGTDIAEWSGNTLQLRTIDTPGNSGGQWVKTCLTLDTASGEFALQQINLYAKVGRIAT